MIIDNLEEEISAVLRNKKLSLKLQVREVFNIIPVKVVKKLKEDEQSNKTDKTSSIKRDI